MSAATKAQTKYWCWVLNNPTEEHMPPSVWPDVEWACWQHERGDEGTDHIQGYAVFKNAKRLQWLKNNCDDRANWKPRESDHLTCKAYHTKEDTRVDGPWFTGVDKFVPKKKGERTDLIKLQQKLLAGTTAQEIYEDAEFFGVWIRSHRAIDRIISDRSPKRNFQTFTQVYWGPSGTGKSRRANYEAGLKDDGTPGEPYYILRKPAGNAVYWDGYKGEKHVVIDEFYGWIPRQAMLTICDRYPTIVDIKNGAVNFAPKKIWITSNDDPRSWWPRIGLGAMARRLKPPCGGYLYMDQPWAPPGEEPAPMPPYDPNLDEPMGFVPLPPADPYQELVQETARVVREEHDTWIASNGLYGRSMCGEGRLNPEGLDNDYPMYPVGEDDDIDDKLN